MSSAQKRKTRASTAAEVTDGAADALAPLVEAVNAPNSKLTTSTTPTTTDNGLQVGAVQDRTESKLLSVLAGRPYSWRRTVTAFILAFVTATLTRQLCFSAPVFGANLGKNLAPIERTDVEWSIVALVRVIDLTIAMTLFYTSGRAVDPPILGALLTLVSRPSLYLFVHHYFLLSTTTAWQIMTTDLVSYGAAAYAMSLLQPRKPTFRRKPISFLRQLSADSIQSAVLALVLGTLVSALILFVTDRLGLKGVIRRGVIERTVPAYHTPNRYGFSFAIRHPSVPIPIIRSNLADLSMSQSLLYSVPLSAALVALALFVLPQAPLSTIAVVAYLLTAPQTTLYLYNVLPFRLPASIFVGAETGLRAAAVAVATAWTLTDVRLPHTIRSLENRKALEVDMTPDGPAAEPVEGSEGPSRYE